MTESTGYLDMNKKTFVIQIKPINSLLFLWRFQTEREPSIASDPKHLPAPKHQPQPHPWSPTPLDPKKIFPCFSQKTIFFHPDRDSNSHLFLTAHAQAHASFPRAAAADSPRARAPAAAARCCCWLPCDPSPRF